jgi:hypothetical protein
MFTQTVSRALPRLGLDQRGSDPHPRQPSPTLLQEAGVVFVPNETLRSRFCRRRRTLMRNTVLIEEMTGNNAPEKPRARNA